MTAHHSVLIFDVLGVHEMVSGKTPEPVTDMDALNAQVLAESRRLSLDEVREREQAAYQALLDTVEAASHDEIFEPGYFAWAKGNAFVGWIEGNTWDHYAEHLPELVAWMKRVA